ncbi:hypothetical protein OIU78_017001 [Salix suchowensis]|nr:hypothetical protein OIU78_017001 [Salix suchowensis]
MGRISPQISHHKALSKCRKHFHHKPFKILTRPSLRVGQFPPKSPVNGIPVAPVNQQQQAWTTGIFDCLEDPSNALITALFPCVTFGQIAEIVDNGQSSMKRNLNPLLYIQSIIKISEI